MLRRLRSQNSKGSPIQGMQPIVMTGKRKTEHNVVDVSRRYDSLNALLKDQIDAEVIDDDSEIDTDRATPRCIAPTPRPRGMQSSSNLRKEHSTKKQKSLPRQTQENKTPRTKNDFRTLEEPPPEPASFLRNGRYSDFKLVGSGSYGKVFKATDKETKNVLALKVIDNLFAKREDSKRIYREVFLLRRLSNPYLIKLRDIVLPSGDSSFDKLCLVFEFVDTDLFRLVRSNQQLGLNYVQFIMYQLLQALNYLHTNNVVHRDLKPANVLIFANCRIKLCDFGLARIIDPDKAGVEEELDSMDQASSEEQPKLEKKLTKHVVTRWYRAPELILLLKYDTKIDIWGAGCILGELLQMQSVPFLKRRPMFPGKSCFPLTAEHDQAYKNTFDQLNQIFKVIGTPSLEDIEGLPSVKGYLLSLEKKAPLDLRAMFPGVHPSALFLLEIMLTFNPQKRANAKEGLMTDFFQMKKKFTVQSESCGYDLSICEQNSSSVVTLEQYRGLLLEEAQAVHY